MSGGVKRPLAAYNPPPVHYRPQQQRFNHPISNSNNRLIAVRELLIYQSKLRYFQQAAQSPSTNNGQALKRSFTADYQNDFHNQVCIHRFSIG